MGSPGPSADPAPYWLDWHSPYNNPESGLSLRLAVVRRRLSEAVDAVPPGPVRILSLCAGQARDIAGLAAHPRRGDVTGRAVELEPANTDVARRLLSEAGLAVEVVTGDASVTEAYLGAAPADVVLACGIFGNISDADITRTIEMLPSLCRPSATVIWTRHRRPPDRTPAIRDAFARAGFEELGFDAPADHVLSVGTNRLVADPAPFRPGVRLFTFTGDGRLPA